MRTRLIALALLGCAALVITAKPRIEYIYAETEQEWLDRCREIIKGER